MPLRIHSGAVYSLPNFKTITMNRIFSGITLVCCTLIACTSTDKTPANTMENPLLVPFETPFELPPFDLISPEHFEPAFTEAIAIHKQEIEAISNQTDAPTFENTIAALDKAGMHLNRVSRIFYNLTSANTNEELEEIASTMAPVLSRHSDEIYMNAALFGRINTLWEQKESLNLTSEQLQLLQKNYKTFVRSGALLTEDEKEKLSALNEELSVLTVKFGQNNLAEMNDYQLIVEDESRLGGLPDGLKEQAAADAEASGLSGKWVFTLQNPSVMPFLQYADDRALRREIWAAFQNKGNRGNDFNNNDIVSQIVNLRLQRAKMLGYATHADYVLEEQMSKSPDRAYALLNDLWKPAIAVAKQEADELNARMRKDGISGPLQPYDWRYYAEKIRQEKYDLNEQELKPYFSLNGVKDGIFMVCKNLFGLQFKQLENVPVYHEDVIAYEVLEADNSHIGVLYMDFHPRASKRSGAWMTSYRSQYMENGKRVAPVISIVCNFSKPSAGAPALLTFDEVETFFHEFGHALHGLLSNVNYRSLAGTSVPTDFVELPSQIMENWASEPEVLRQYAKHYQTGEIIPDALIEKMLRSSRYGQGFATAEYLAAAMLDLAYHMQKNPLEKSVQEFEKQVVADMGLIEEIIPRYRSTYFNHTFAGGYSARYYSYIWSGVLDTDAFEAFKETALFDPETAKSFRKNILERGGSADAMEMYINFRGKEPSIEPLLRKRGLTRVKQALPN
jgi:peptidyl-dipeptidase Dcp